MQTEQLRGKNYEKSGVVIVIEPERWSGKKSAGGRGGRGEITLFPKPRSVHPASCALGEASEAFHAEV